MRSLVCILFCILGCTSFRTPESFAQSSRKQDFLQLDWPIDRARLTQRFIPHGKSRHAGIDLAASKGTPIFSAQAGRVAYTGNGFRGYGNLVIIEHDENWSSFYSHLNQILVEEGEWVPKGKTIAAMGRTGRASGNHLHFELRWQKKPIDPLEYLP